MRLRFTLSKPSLPFHHFPLDSEKDNKKKKTELFILKAKCDFLFSLKKKRKEKEKQFVYSSLLCFILSCIFFVVFILKQEDGGS